MVKGDRGARGGGKWDRYEGSGIDMREVGVEIKKELVCCLLLLVIQSKTSTLKIFLLPFNATKALNEIS